VQTDDGFVIVDPIILADEPLAELCAASTIVAVVVSNVNHARAALDYARRYHLSMIGPIELITELPGALPLTDGASINGLEVFALPGAAAGEFAFYDAREGGTLIVGDALINFAPYNFTLLPRKYCLDQKELVRSLRRLLDLFFNRIFFAHGYPIVTGARARLATLLNDIG